MIVVTFGAFLISPPAWKKLVYMYPRLPVFETLFMVVPDLLVLLLHSFEVTVALVDTLASSITGVSACLTILY